MLSLVGTGVFTHCLSVPLLFEYEDVLKRPGVVPLGHEAVEDILDGLCATADRRPLLEIAVTGQCDTIVTFTRRHFVGSERFGVRIQTPAEFLVTPQEKGER